MSTYINDLEALRQELQELKGQVDLLEAVEDAVRFQDTEGLANLVEAGDQQILNTEMGQKLLAGLLRGEYKGKRGISGREQKRKAKRDRFIIQTINIAIGGGASPVWSADDPGICGMVSQLLFERGLKPMEPEAIYRHVWSKRKKETNDQLAWRLMGEMAQAGDKRVRRLEENMQALIQEARDE